MIPHNDIFSVCLAKQRLSNWCREVIVVIILGDKKKILPTMNKLTSIPIIYSLFMYTISIYLIVLFW